MFISRLARVCARGYKRALKRISRGSDPRRFDVQYEWNVAVLIPSYDRPEVLEITLPRWINAKNVNEVFIVAEASSEHLLRKYEEFLGKLKSVDKITYKLFLKRRGSVWSRNTLLESVARKDYKYVVMADDDYLLSDEDTITLMRRDLESSEEVGMVGGKAVPVKRRSIDPDFFLNLPANLADLLSRLTGYIFLNIKRGPRYSEFLSPFFMLRGSLVSKVRYDEVFETPTSFREESDVQLQVKNMGFKLLHDPRAYVIHLGAERGGNRPKMSMAKRMYWKARNHTVFILKWNKSVLKMLWYMMSSVLILSIYRIWYVPWIFRGIKDGITRAKAGKICSKCA
jgi:glycosyltransferase involved in cell wall biosynthesis